MQVVYTHNHIPIIGVSFVGLFKQQVVVVVDVVVVVHEVVVVDAEVVKYEFACRLQVFYSELAVWIRVLNTLDFNHSTGF